MPDAPAVTPRWVARTVVLAVIGAVTSVLCERLLRRSPLLGVLLSALVAGLVLTFVVRRMRRARSSSTDRLDVTLALAYVGALGTFLGQRLAARSLVAAAVASGLLAIMALGLVWASARAKRPPAAPIVEEASVPAVPAVPAAVVATPPIAVPPVEAPRAPEPPKRSSAAAGPEPPATS